MANLTAAQIAEKQVRRAATAVQDYKDGILNTKVNPMEVAASRVDAWAAGVQRALTDGSYVDGLLSTPKQVWVDAATKKGAANYVPGITAAQGIIADFHQQRMQVQSGIDNQLASMPRGDFNTNMQRMVTQATLMHNNFKFKKRR